MALVEEGSVVVMLNLAQATSTTPGGNDCWAAKVPSCSLQQWEMRDQEDALYWWRRMTMCQSKHWSTVNAVALERSFANTSLDCRQTFGHR